MKTGVGVLIFDVNRSRIEVGFCNFGAGLESESQKSNSGHLWFGAKANDSTLAIPRCDDKYVCLVESKQLQIRSQK